MKINDEMKKTIIKLDNEGATSREIADLFEVGKSTIGDFLRKETYQVWWAEQDTKVDILGSIVPPYKDDHASESGRVIGGDTCLNLSAKNAEDIFSSRQIRAIHPEVDNSRILHISDMHMPYNHPDLFEFLAYLKAKYNPTRIICGGDELDKHALSFHDSDPDLPSAGDELRASLPMIAKLKEMFPVMDILDSNHGSLVYRKSKAHGIPRHYIKSYNEVLEVDDNWKWHFDMTITLPNGQQCYYHHGKLSNVTKVSQQMGMNAVQFHFHETFKVEYWGNPTGLYWALQSGCLIDDKSYAFSYNNVNVKRPIIGTTLIINSLPVLEPMLLDSDGRWTGRKK